MKTCTSLLIAFLLLLVGLAVPAAAEVVGRLTQVEGRVDFLKGGKLPAAAAKLDDSVEVGDVLRTKSLSKAQITFMDNTVITVSPESRIAIEEYMFDPGKGKRSAVLQLFQGLAHVVVSKLFKVAEPDFLVKTNTAVMGVRGTEVGIRLGPNDSTFLNFQGLTRVANIFPEVSGDLFRKAAKVAFSFGSSGFVDLKDMQGTVVSYGLPPTLPFGITDQDRQMFNRQLSGAFAQQRAAVGTPGSSSGGGGSLMSGSLAGATSPGALNPLTTTTTNSLAVQPLITPTLTRPAALTQQAVTPASLVLGTVSIPFYIQASWGSGVTDLDLHLTGPNGSGSTFHVYYGNVGSLTAQPYAQLLQDHTGYSGSEVIQVQQFNQGGLYQASVFNFGNQSTTSTNLSTTAGLSLSVIKGGTPVTQTIGTATGTAVNGGIVIATVTPTAGQAGNTWQAVQINPANGQVTNVNTVVNSANSASVR